MLIFTIVILKNLLIFCLIKNTIKRIYDKNYILVKARLCFYNLFRLNLTESNLYIKDINKTCKNLLTIFII